MTRQPGSERAPGETEAVDACARVRDRVREGTALPADLMAHVRDCAPCASMVELAGAGSAVGAMGEPARGTDELLAALHADLTQQLEAEKGVRAWLRERPTSTRVILAIVGAVAVPLYWLVASRRPDFGAYPAARLMLDLGLFLVPAAFIVPVVLRPLHRRPWPEWVRPALVVATIVATVLLVAMPQAHQGHAASLLGTGDDLASRALACFLTGTISGLPLALWLWMISRQGKRPWQLGALALLLAAIVGGLAAFLHCPITSPLHLTLGHATIMLPFLVVALFGRG